METEFCVLDEFSQAAVRSMGIVDAKKKAAAKSKGGKTGIKEVKKHMKGGIAKKTYPTTAEVKKKTYPTTAEVLYPEAKCQ